MTDAQERLWFLAQLGTSARHHHLLAFRVGGPLDVAALERALQGIERRHPSLRTRFRWVDGKVVTSLSEPATVSLAIETATDVGAAVAAEGERAFDLASGSLIRCRLLRLGVAEHVITLSVHEIAADRRSVGLLVEEIGARYRSPSCDATRDAPVDWNAAADVAPGEERAAALLAHWQARLADLPVVELPSERASAAPSFLRGRVPIDLAPSLTAALDGVARAAGATRFMVLVAAYQCLLLRHTGQSDLSVGTVVPGRPPGAERIIGSFENALVLRTDLGGNPTFRELLGRVRSVVDDANAHQQLRFEKLVEHLKPERSFGRTPLFQHQILVEETPPPRLDLGGLTVTAIDPGPRGGAPFETSLGLAATAAGGLSGELAYRSDRFDRVAMERVAAQLAVLLEGIAGDASRPIGELPLLPEAELRQLEEWNTSAHPPPGDFAHRRFAAQAARTPAATAIRFEDQELTYRELDRRANQLAHHLARLGVGAEVRVGICVDRSPAMVVAVLATLKAGGAFVPLDPVYPEERLAFMVDDAAIAVLLTEECHLASLPPHAAQVVCLDRDWAEVALEAEAPLDVAVVAAQLAYVVYTSGSTGRPKGVLIEQRGLCNLADEQRVAFGVRPDGRVLQFASFSFDAAVSEILVTLLAGATLVIAPTERLLGDALLDLLRAQRITVVTLPPSVLAMLSPEDLPHLETVVSAGEACTAAIVARWSTGRRLVNAYGPSEATVCATMGECAPGDPRPTIGRPIGHCEVWILDGALARSPIGAVGELFIGGIGVARGYHLRDALTAEKFIPNRFGAGCLYRTGDLGRFRSDGRIEFLGRIDQQVKLRGFRIELGEIEAVLRQYPSLSDVVVLLREDRPGDRRLVAYLVAEGDTPSHFALREFLLTKLPQHMVPSAFLRVAAFPTTPNGKVDRRALPAPDESRPTVMQIFVAPRDDMEKAVAQIWQELFRIEAIGVTDDFFDLGGNSLLAMRLMAEISAKFGKRLSLATLFRGATVEHLAEELRGQQSAAAWSPLVPMHAGKKRPFFCVHPIAGNVLCYLDLARLVGADRPFYGIQARGLDEDQEPHADIEAMATEYLAAIAAVQPRGPYLLGGWSAGGIIAFEMAQQLVARGETVELLAMIDARAPTAPTLAAARQITDDFSDAMMAFWFVLTLGRCHGVEVAVSHEAFHGIARDAIVERMLAELHTLGALSRDLAPHAEINRLLRLYSISMRALLSYAPRPYPGPIHLFQSTDEVPLRARAPHPPPWGWEPFASEITYEKVPGNHFTLVYPPHVDALAARLRAALENVR